MNYETGAISDKRRARKRAKYWGKFIVKKVVQLNHPEECKSDEIGLASFEPTIVKIVWNNPPSLHKNELWFPYWITIKGKEKYGQYAPMMSESSLIELLEKAINKDFFSEEFISQLNQVIQNKLNKDKP